MRWLVETLVHLSSYIRLPEDPYPTLWNHLNFGSSINCITQLLTVLPCPEKKINRFQVSVDRWILIVKKRSRYQKTSPWSEVFFGHIFVALRRTPYTQSAKISFAGHFENPQFSVLSASEHLQRPEMCPHHQDFFYLVKLYDKKLLRKYLVPHNTPRTHISNKKNRDFWPTGQTSTPEIQG